VEVVNTEYTISVMGKDSLLPEGDVVRGMVESDAGHLF